MLENVRRGQGHAYWWGTALALWPWSDLGLGAYMDLMDVTVDKSKETIFFEGQEMLIEIPFYLLYGAIFSKCWMSTL